MVSNKLEVWWVDHAAMRRVSARHKILACRILTAGQQAIFSLGFAALGAVAAAAWWPSRTVDPVVLLDPVIERSEADYSVYRLRFASSGTELAPCHIVAWHQTGKWTVRCS